MLDVTIGIIDAFHPRSLDVIRQALPQGWRLSIAKSGSLQDRAAALEPADVAFVMAAPMPLELLGAAGKLRFVQKLGVGVDRIDLDFCREKGVAVARLHAGNSIPVAEHTILMMMAACRRLPHLDREVRAGAWNKEQSRGESRQLSGMAIGIVGFGAIGQAVARMLAGFGVRIFYFDPRRAPADVELATKAQFMDLDNLLASADIVSMHLPLLPETRNLIDEKRIARMKRGAIIVNCARGGLVDERALNQALQEGHLFGAAVDAFDAEPPVGSPLLTNAYTVLTPHTAGATLDNFASVVERAVENATHVLAGRDLPPLDVVVPAPAPADGGPR